MCSRATPWAAWGSRSAGPDAAIFASPAALYGIPSVWLPGGGYHPNSWQVLAGTVLAVSRHNAKPIHAGDDPMGMRFTRLSRRLHSQIAQPSSDLSLHDVEADLGVGGGGRHLLLGVYSPEAVEYVLYRFNLLRFLERRGYSQFRVALGTATSGGERLCLFGQAAGREHLLVEGVLQRRLLAGRELLYLHWLALRDPLARFSDKRPRLPGQDVPGLGLVREAAQLLGVFARQVGLLGVAFTPAWYHTAYVARGRFTFVDPVRQGRFEAMIRDFAEFSLAEVSTAFASGRVRRNGVAYTWEPDDMVGASTPSRPWIASSSRPSGISPTSRSFRPRSRRKPLSRTRDAVVG